MEILLDRNFRGSKFCGDDQGGSILAFGHSVATLDQLRDCCRDTEHRVIPIHSVGDGIEKSAPLRADLVIVEDGNDLASQGVTERVCRSVREQHGAHYTVVVAAEPSESRERVVIGAGADYYIAPLQRLAAYLETLMTRARGERTKSIVLGPLVVDRARRRCTLQKEPLALTRAEFEILQQLALKSGQLVAIQELTKLLGTSDNASSRARIRQHVYVIRRKSPLLMSMLRTVRGCGYLLQAGS
jgi:DNA-binding response OmpR family regulator